jgi:hypothetical protein
MQCTLLGVQICGVICFKWFNLNLRHLEKARLEFSNVCSLTSHRFLLKSHTSQSSSQLPYLKLSSHHCVSSHCCISS